MKRMVCLFIVLAVVTSMAFAQKVSTVRIMTQFGEDTKHEGIRLISEAVTKLYPQYVFEIEHLGWDNYVQKLKQQMAAGDPPSIFSGNVIAFPDFIKAGKVLDLSNQPWVKDYPKAAFSESIRDGKVWSMPYDFGAIGIFYSKEMFKKYNLKVPTTRAEWIKVCDTFKKNGITPIAFGGSEKDPCGYTVEPFLFSSLNSTPSGKVAIRKIMDGQLSVLDVPEIKLALSSVYEMFCPYIETNDMSIPREKAYDMFMAQDRPMTLHGSFVVGVFRAANPNADIGVFPVPNFAKAADNKLQGIMDDNMMASTDGNTDAAQKWLAFASSKEGLEIWAKAAYTFPASKLAAQVQSLDPLSKEMKSYMDNGRSYMKGDLSTWETVYGTEWQGICQKFIADGISAQAKGVKTDAFVSAQLKDIDKRIKALK
jgi:raffinose/stachyose/melibiose transport system substrate-binding protein